MKVKLRISKSVLLEAAVQELAGPAVAGVIGKEEYDKIKAKDAHPMFIKLDVGKQGESGGAVIFAGIKKLWRKIWSSTRIKEIGRWLNRKVPLFFGHGATNDQTGRRKIGETIKGWTEEMNDGLHAFSIGYIPSKNPDIQEMITKKEIDICSIEAQLEFSLMKLGRLFVEKVKDLSAVALGSTQLGHSPGFATAGIVGVVQEMAVTKEELDEALKQAGIDPEEVEVEITDDKNRGKRRKRGMEREELSIEDVASVCKSRKIKPDEIYDLNELLKVGAVKDAVENEASERVTRIEEDKEEEIGKLQEVIDGKETELQKAVDDIKTKDDAIKAKDAEIQPFKAEQRQNKIAVLVSKSLLLKDKPQQMTDYIRSHASVSEDVDLDAATAGAIVDQAIQEQILDIEKSGITFKEEEPEPKPGEGEGDEEPTVGFGDDNPLKPDSEKESE